MKYEAISRRRMHAIVKEHIQANMGVPVEPYDVVLVSVAKSDGDGRTKYLWNIHRHGQMTRGKTDTRAMFWLVAVKTPPPNDRKSKCDMNIEKIYRVPTAIANTRATVAKKLPEVRGCWLDLYQYYPSQGAPTWLSQPTQEKTEQEMDSSV